MSGEILSVGEAGKHAGGINTLIYDNDHVYSGGSDGVINVSYNLCKFLFDKKKFHPYKCINALKMQRTSNDKITDS